MILEEIIAELRTQSAAAALTAGVTHAHELAPVVYAIAGKFCRGVHLLPIDNELLFNGLHVLGAGRHHGLRDQVIAIARQSGDQLDQLFPDHVTVSLARLLVSVWDQGADSLFTLIEHVDMAPEAKWALYEMLARLTFDARISREQTTIFLARIENDKLIDDGDMTRWGWEQAVVKLGLVELEPALRRVWSKPIYGQHRETDHTVELDRLRRAAADPSDARLFDEEDIRPIDDPVDAVASVERRAATMAAWTAEQEADHRSFRRGYARRRVGRGGAIGIEMQNDAWDPIFEDRRADQIVMPILALCGPAPEEVHEQLTAAMRKAILDQLPATVQMIAAYWRAPIRGFPRREPVRSTKVGRNALCPCGSGRKFKKCCGSGPPPLLH